MPDVYSSLILPDVRLMVAEEDRHGLSEFCRVLHPAVVADILEELSPREVWTVLDHADLRLRVEIFEYIGLRRQTELVEQLDKRRLSELLEEMSADDRVDLLSRMPHDRVEDLLPLIAQAERNDIRRLLSYDQDSAGSIMTTEYASLPANITVAEALNQLRQQAPDSETIYYIYILNNNRRLEGSISLRELILARPESILSDIMQRDVIRMRVDEDRIDVAQELARYNFIAMPIVDNEDRLVGIVTHDDALDVVQEEATRDAYRQSAVEPLRDDYEDTPLLTILWKRGIWLLLLSIVALMTAGVADFYRKATEEGGARAADAPAGLTSALIFLFIPLVMASGGNAGSQSATLFIRMFALQPMDTAVPGTGFWVDRRIVMRELCIAALLGSILGLMDFLFVWLWFQKGTDRAAVVGLTVFLIVVLGTTAGTLLPILFRRLKMDPAIMSNPLIAAMVDVLGVVIFYEVAMLVL
ncbi:MAG: magnesium transporter [Planctomycetaceae bacterium]|nr:magnesium transporter [Planctomycetaceae bacterium]